MKKLIIIALILISSTIYANPAKLKIKSDYTEIRTVCLSGYLFAVAFHENNGVAIIQVMDRKDVARCKK